MTDKIDRLIEELKLCETHAAQYNLLKAFSFRSFFAGLEAQEKKKSHVSVLHRALNLMKKKKA